MRWIIIVRLRLRSGFRRRGVEQELDEELRYHLDRQIAGLALLLAAIGVYGVMAHTIVQRTQEMGIRMALGAARRDVMRLMLGRSARLVVVGVVAGAFGALLAGKLLETLLFGVTPTDPLTFVLVPLLLALVALLAAWGPVHRATRVDPLTALRHE